MTLGLGQILHRTDAVCPVHRYVQPYSILLVRQLKYVRFIGMNICILKLKGDEIGLDHRKYVRFIGMNVCPRSSVLRGRNQSMSGSSVSSFSV